MPKGTVTVGRVSSWYPLISGKSCAGLRRQSVSDISIESIATAGAVLAFLLAAAAGITSRRGIQLIVIGMLFSLLPHVSGVGRTWIAGQRGSHERSNARGVKRADRGPEMDWGCISRPSRASVESGGSRSALANDARCR